MTRLAWLTDIHLEFLEPDQRLAFVDHLAESVPDIVLVVGDTGIASNFASFLQIIERRLECPIYFVLGNHDFYRGSIAEVRAAAEKLTKSSPLAAMAADAGNCRNNEDNRFDRARFVG